MERVGFIGLGIMGKPMAHHLIKAGYPLTVLSSSKAADELSLAGAMLVQHPKELTASSDVIITMLPDSPEVEEIMFGANGVFEGMTEGKLFIDMSTISPGSSTMIFQRLAEKNVEALDAPVSGGQVGAESASLSIMVGGNTAAFSRALPLFQAMGKNIVLIGAAGSGQITKACNQMIVGMTIQAVAEAFALAKEAGVDLEKMREVLLGGFAQSKILDLHGKRMLEGNFKPGFKVRLHKKDLDIATKTAQDLGVVVKGTEQVAEQMAKAVAVGNGELDHSSLFLLLEK